MRAALKHWFFINGSAGAAELPDTFTRGWITSDEFTFSDNLVTPITNLGQVDRIREYRNTSVQNNLVWIGTDPASGKGQHTAVDTYGSGQKPIWLQNHGGLIFIPNTFDRHYETGTMTAISGACTAIKFSIPLAGTLNEYESNSSNKLLSIRDRSNNRIAWGRTNTEVDPTTGGIPDMYKVHMYVGYRAADGNMYAEIDGVPYNGGTLMAIGTNNITEQAIGSTGHPADFLHGPCFYIAGTQTPGDAAWTAMIAAYRAWYEDFSGLTLNSYPTAFPYATFDGGGFNDTLIWTNATNRFTLPSSLTLKNGATSWRVTWWEGGTVNGVQYENRTHLKTQTGSSISDFFLARGVDFGSDPETVTNLWICAEVTALNGVEEMPFDIKTKFKADNTT